MSDWLIKMLITQYVIIGTKARAIEIKSQRLPPLGYTAVINIVFY